MRIVFGAMCLQHQLHKSSQNSETCAQFECHSITLLSLHHSLIIMDSIEIFSYTANLWDQVKLSMARCLTIPDMGEERHLERQRYLTIKLNNIKSRLEPPFQFPSLLTVVS